MRASKILATKTQATLTKSAILKLAILFAVPSVLVLAAGCSSVSKTAKFKLRDYQDYTLKNGMKVTLIQDNTLPYFSLEMLVKMGAAQDPKDLSGTGYMVAELLDKGTKNYTALQLADALEQYAGSFHASVGEDYTTVSASALSMHQDKLLEHVAEILLRPTFAQSEVNRLKKRLIASIKQMPDEPEQMIEQAFGRFVYGDHPYGRPTHGWLTDLGRIKKKHITRHYLQYFRPNNITMAIVGNFTGEIKSKIEKHFGEWQPREMPAFKLADPKLSEQQKILLVNKGDLAQAQIRLGHVGIERNHPDFIPLRVANTILGGSFSSRLMQEVRVARGLTYSIGSGFDTRKENGMFVVSTFTRFDKINETIQSSMAAVKAFRERGATAKELADAKALLKGQFPRALETAEALASNLLALRFFGVPDSYFRTYLSDVEKITMANVNRVTQKHIHPQWFKIVVYAPADKALSQLKPLGEVAVEQYGKVL